MRHGEGRPLTGQPVVNGQPNKDHGEGRICLARRCDVRLSRYNSGEYCWEHRMIEYPYERPFPADGRLDV